MTLDLIANKLHFFKPDEIFSKLSFKIKCNSRFFTRHNEGFYNDLKEASQKFTHSKFTLKSDRLRPAKRAMF